MIYCPYCGLELERDEYSLLECKNCQIAMTVETVGALWRGRWLEAGEQEPLAEFIEWKRSVL
jgi:Zn-finger nucleic acid-binding protein